MFHAFLIRTLHPLTPYLPISPSVLVSISLSCSFPFDSPCYRSDIALHIYRYIHIHVDKAEKSPHIISI